MEAFFCGWYIKCQNDVQTLALIPAYHICGGKKSCSVQVITEEKSWNVELPFSYFSMGENGVDIGLNHFGRESVLLDLDTPQLRVKGELFFGPFAPLGYDIMGPFRYVPFMECRHRVFSMGHQVDGCLAINGQAYPFDNGICYVEGDRGRSFPKSYLWTQCCFPEGSIMLSLAEIPFCGMHFTGIICAILLKGREIRLATYLGARVVHLAAGEVTVRQGNKSLTVKLLEKKAHPLAAPVGGAMKRTIHESAACRVSYRYREQGKTVLEFTSFQASFEYEYPR